MLFFPEFFSLLFSPELPPNRDSPFVKPTVSSPASCNTGVTDSFTSIDEYEVNAWQLG